MPLENLEYSFYKDVYLGTKLSEDTFTKYIQKGLSIISKYTMDRVNENNIDTYPERLSTNIKKCACELAEFSFDIDKINDNFVSANSGSSGNSSSSSKTISGPIKTVTAGAVSYTVDTSTTSSLSNVAAKNYLDSKYIIKRYKSILNDYLYPQHIGNTYYNLMSFIRR